MKTLKTILDEVAVKHGYKDFYQVQSRDNFDTIITEAGKIHVQQALELAASKTFEETGSGWSKQIILSIIQELK